MKNKKGNSPLWLAANGGHLAVVEMLYAAGADIDSQDNRKVIMTIINNNHIYSLNSILHYICLVFGANNSFDLGYLPGLD